PGLRCRTGRVAGALHRPGGGGAHLALHPAQARSTDMTFVWPAVLWGLALLPLLLLALVLVARGRRRRQRRLADDHLWATLARPAPVGRARWTLGLQLSALTLLLVAGARPVASPPWPANRAAVIIA